MNTIYGIPIAGKKVLFEQGCLSRVKYWLIGHHRGLYEYAEYITGLSGPETVITVERLMASVVVEVTDGQS